MHALHRLPNPRRHPTTFRFRLLPFVFAAFASLALWPAESMAGNAQITTIGQLTPFPKPGVSIGVTGLAFDGSPGALVLDRWSWEVSRVSLSNASVISTTDSLPLQSYASQLSYDDATGDLYTIEGNTRLVRMAAGTLANSIVGTNLGDFFNFVGLGKDLAGNLWLGVDNGGPQLWSIDKTTGLGTLEKILTLPVNHQLQRMMIDSAGRFILFIDGPSDNFFAELDSNTGNWTQLNSVGSTRFNALSYDPLTHAYYGITTANTLVRIDNVPEPGTLVLMGLGAAGLVCGAQARRKRSRHACSRSKHA